MSAANATSLQALYAKPGFMIRRAHQICAALFDEAAASCGITTTQYSVLHALRAQPGLDQITLCETIGIDRSTATLVLRLLEQNGLIERTSDPDDKRRNLLQITAAGHDRLRDMAPVTNAVSRRMLEAIEEDELAELLRILEKFVGSFNDRVRNPLLTAKRAPKARQAKTRKTK